MNNNNNNIINYGKNKKEDKQATTKQITKTTFKCKQWKIFSVAFSCRSCFSTLPPSSPPSLYFHHKDERNPFIVK